MWTEKQLKMVLGILALIPIITGFISLFGIFDPIYDLEPGPELTLLDSNLRFFGGVWLVLGLALLTTLSRLHSPNPMLQWLLAAVFLGGIGRLMSMFFLGPPPIPFILFTLLEIIGMPALMLWQFKLSTANTRH